MVESMVSVGSPPCYNIHVKSHTTLISGVFIFKLLKIRYNIVRVWNTRLFSFSISIV